MAANKGNLMLLKVGDGASSESFTTISGQRSTSMTVNNNTVDISTKDTTQWIERLEQAALTGMTISTSGIFKDAASEETLRGYAMANTIDNYEFDFGNGDKISGAFQITSYERGGDYEGAGTYSATLESAGTITFTGA